MYTTTTLILIPLLITVCSIFGYLILLKLTQQTMRWIDNYWEIKQREHSQDDI